MTAIRSAAKPGSIVWQRRLAIFASAVPRTKLQRVALILVVFCAVNAAWAIVGNWSISFGGESYSHFIHGSRQSGIYSCRGYLVIAVRNSSFIGSGLRPPDWQTRKPTRQTYPVVDHGGHGRRSEHVFVAPR